MLKNKIITCFMMLSVILSETKSNTLEYIPDVILKDINKQKIKLLDISKDKYIVFNFWNMACEPCKKEMKFLNELAKNKRNLSSSRFIAVTGSSGKTTVKTMLGNLLNEYSKTYFSPKSYNNQYGVPLSISNVNSNDSFGV